MEQHQGGGLDGSHGHNHSNTGEAAAGESGTTNSHSMSNIPPQSEQGGQGSHPPQQGQQEPVNFNPRSDPYHPSRRVTIGGSMHTNKADRRNSLSSMSFNMDDFFGPGAGRRPSMGGDSTFPDALFGRRDSLDSSTAALDAAIFDLTRRRLSVAPNFQQDPYAARGNQPMAGDWGRGSLDLSQRSGGNPAASGDMMNATYPQVGGYGPAGYPAGQGGMAMGGSLAQKQQQLQAQQRMLEQQQRELELQRQELINSMQQRNMMMRQDPPPMDGSARLYHRPDERRRTPGSLGLGSVHSQGSTSDHLAPPIAASQGYGNQGTTTGGGSQQWWICQVCNTKAFASHNEALAHEAICQGGSSRGNRYMSASMHDHSSARGRNYSMGMDSSQHTVHTSGTVASYEVPRYSSGPFAMMDKPSALAMVTDKEWLTPLHCFVRRHCVEVFTASEAEVSAPSKGKRKPIQVGQVGIRCPHCHSADNSKARERGSVYYPTTISSIYNATMNLLQRHLHSCTSVPGEIMRRYETLKADDARSGTSKRYWIESALSLGLVDTPNGIRFSALEPPPLPSLTRSQESMVDSTRGQSARRNSNDFFSSSSNAVTDDGSKAAPEQPGDAPTEQALTETAPLTEPEDKAYSTAFSYHLLSQMQPCVFTEADRLGKRKGLPPGFPGLACRHCFGGYGSGRFFPSSIKTLSDTSKTLNVLHNHMMRCRKCPPDVRETLEKLRGSHDEERAKMKFGSQKAFFARIWDRLHGNKPDQSSAGVKRKAPPVDYSMQQQQSLQHSPRARHEPPPQTATQAAAAPGPSGAAAMGNQH
mmetsp:Transcript_2123/g.4627  ORF Transcript_2123/g.4627 Transcript_2123/m.4627 type:complete len:812 (-) Transcript_2123:154-2589(-)|eukprot:scaffold1181_cov152-Amphora_coffeaeformis.AAC.1